MSGTRPIKAIDLFGFASAFQLPHLPTYTVTKFLLARFVCSNLGIGRRLLCAPLEARLFLMVRFPSLQSAPGPHRRRLSPISCCGQVSDTLLHIFEVHARRVFYLALKTPAFDLALHG